MASVILLSTWGLVFIVAGVLELGRHDMSSVMTGALMIGMGNVCMEIRKLRGRL